MQVLRCLRAGHGPADRVRRWRPGCPDRAPLCSAAGCIVQRLHSRQSRPSPPNRPRLHPAHERGSVLRAALLPRNTSPGARTRCRTGAKPMTGWVKSAAGVPTCASRSKPARPRIRPGRHIMRTERKAMHPTFPAPRTLTLAVLSAILLGGCASCSTDGGFETVRSATQSRIQKDVVWSRDEASHTQIRARIDALLAQPLSADDAVQIALLNNPGLQAAFNTLGIAEADWVAAQQSAHYQQQTMDAAEAGAELARRMAQVGNWSKLKQAREQSFYADAALAVARAEQTKLQARERLVRLLGLPHGDALQLPERLPDLPATLPALPEVEQQAMDSRLDLQAARLQTEALARNLGLTRRTRFDNVLELGAISNSSNEVPLQRGYEISFELPLFDWGQTRVVQAESRYRQALERAREIAVNARSEERAAYAMQQSQSAIARHLRDEVVPLKQRISEENQYRYNGMLIGVFELLADARSQIASVNAAIEAQRDFWLADADMRMALAGTPGKTPVTSLPSASADAAGGH